MKVRLSRGSFLWITALCPVAFARMGTPESQFLDDPKLPSGKSQKNEILKAEREDNIRDAGRLVEMAQGLKDSFEKSDRFVLSMGMIKELDDIDKMVKKMRDRLRH